jgi:hypothetical protein
MFVCTRPGGYSAKNTHQVGAPNTQQSGEIPMVSNNAARVPEGTEVTYHGSVARFVGQRFYVLDCEHGGPWCTGYELEDGVQAILRHVRRESFTPISEGGVA